MKQMINLLLVISFLAVTFTSCDTDGGNSDGGNTGPKQSVSFITDSGRLEFFQDGDTIRIPAGTYNIKVRDNRDHVFLNWLSNVTIDATDVTFIFDDIFFDGLHVDHCANITVKGATLYYKQKSFTQGTITRVGSNYVNFRLEEGYPEPQEINNGTNALAIGIVYGGNGTIKPGTFDLYDDYVESLGGGEYKFDCNITNNISIGDRIAIRHCLARAVVTISSEAIVFDGIQVLSGGMGFVEGEGKGGHVYRNCVVRPLNEGDLLSTAADAFHSSNIEKGPTIDGCLFERMGDDGANIHGILYRVSTGGNGAFTIDSTHWLPAFEPGDTLRIYRNGSELVTPPITVTEALKLENDKCRVTVDREVTLVNGDLVFTPNRVGAGFVIRNTTVRNNRARGFLIQSRDGTIDGCTIDGSSMYAILIEADLEYYMESMYAENVTISNCTIRNVNYNGHTSSQPDILVHPKTRNINITNIIRG